VSRMLTGGVGYRPHRDRPVLIRDLDMMRNALSALPLEGALYELSVIRMPNSEALMIQLRLDAPPIALVTTESVAVTMPTGADDEDDTLPILPKG
jgi:hypothetical protein